MRVLLLVSVLFCPSWSRAGEAPTPFPLPTEQAALPDGVRTIRIELPFAHVERYYRKQFARARDVTLQTTTVGGRAVLVVASRRESDGWGRAVVMADGERAVVVRVTPMYRLQGFDIEGDTPAAVRIVIPRHSEASRLGDEIDHLRRRR